MNHFSTRLAGLAALCLLTFGCQQEISVADIALATPEPIYAQLPVSTKSLGKGADGSSVRIAMAEFVTPADADEIGNRVFFNDRGNKQLAYDFAPGTSGDGTDAISYYIDATRPSNDLPLGQTSDAIDRAMTTWDDATCSDLDIFRIPATGQPTGLVSAVYGYGGSTDYVADVVHNGWLPGAFFSKVFGSRGKNVLGVTFTLVLLDANGREVDTNNDGKSDVAWREIYYNDRFNWATSIDVETIALHEAGHGLSQEHFGKGFRNTKTGEVKYSPRAVMNAIYSGVQTTVAGTDNAGHCSLWGSWPNK
ncbi:hypothetical protein [Lewinella sp. IMCC34183]|uniref:hypothetical protein n=1 Tax=Lewinella sp. IMCC34183 TaxID=2248762 RepID=UPI000E2710B1|nr:hypothetical protein [Lewinella sp. IMCC34183]